MTTEVFTIAIRASVTEIWAVLWGDQSYSQWTSVFCEGSYIKTNWDEGSSAQFLSPNGEGMDSIILEKKENEYIAFKHISEIRNFEVQPIDEATKEWSGAMETYRLIPKGDFVVLEVKMDILDKYLDYFQTAFPKGLEKVKELVEQNK